MSEMSSPSYTVTGFIRQNPWGKLDNQLAAVTLSQKVHCPWGHTQRDVEEYEANPAGFSKKYAKHFTRFATGSLLMIAEAKKDTALLVRLVTAPRVGALGHYILVRKAERACGHSLTQPGRGCKNGCADCEDSIVQIYHRNEVPMERLYRHMLDGCIAEPFHTIYREVEIVGHVRLTGEDAETVRHYAACQASLKKTGIEVPAALVTPA